MQGGGRIVAAVGAAGPAGFRYSRRARRVVKRYRIGGKFEPMNGDGARIAACAVRGAPDRPCGGRLRRVWIRLQMIANTRNLNAPRHISNAPKLPNR